jgi:hypothetical protein
MLKNHMESAKKSATVLAAASEGIEHQNNVHLYKELEAAKAEREQVPFEKELLLKWRHVKISNKNITNFSAGWELS